MNLKDMDCVMDEPSGNANDSESQSHMLVLLFWFFRSSLRLASLDSDAGTDSRLMVVHLEPIFTRKEDSVCLR